MKNLYLGILLCSISAVSQNNTSVHEKTFNLNLGHVSVEIDDTTKCIVSISGEVNKASFSKQQLNLNQSYTRQPNTTTVVIGSINYKYSPSTSNSISADSGFHSLTLSTNDNALDVTLSYLVEHDESNDLYAETSLSTDEAQKSNWPRYELKTVTVRIDNVSARSCY